MGSYKRVGRGSQVLPLQIRRRRVDGTSFSHADGGRGNKRFWVSFNAGALSHAEGGPTMFGPFKRGDEKGFNLS